MSRIEYFHVFEAIIYGLVFARYSRSWYQMYINRDTIKAYWVHTLLTILFFLGFAIRYYNTFNNPAFEEITSFSMFFILLMIPPFAFYFQSEILFPDKFESTDFKELLISRRVPIVLSHLVQVAGVAIQNIASYKSVEGVSWNNIFTMDVLASPYFMMFVTPFIFSSIMDVFVAYNKNMLILKLYAILPIPYFIFLFTV